MDKRLVLALLMATVIIFSIFLAFTLFKIGEKISDNKSHAGFHPVITLVIENITDKELLVTIKSDVYESLCIDKATILDQNTGQACCIIIPEEDNRCLFGTNVVKFNISDCNLRENITYLLKIEFTNELEINETFRYIVAKRKEKLVEQQEKTGINVTILLRIKPGTTQAVLEEVYRIFREMEIPFTISTYASYVLANPETCNNIFPYAESVVSSTYNYPSLIKIPAKIAELEIKEGIKLLDSCFNNVVPEILDAPWGELDTKTLSLVGSLGVKYVILDGVTAKTYRVNETYVIESVDIDLFEPFSMNGTYIISINLDEINTKEQILQVKRQLENIKELESSGKVRFVTLDEAIRILVNNAYSVSSIEKATLEQVPGSEFLWEAYSLQLQDIADMLKNLDETRYNKSRILEAINTSVFWTNKENMGKKLDKYRVTQKVVLKSAATLVSELMPIVKWTACYYLTNIDMRKLKDRHFRVLVIEMEEGLTPKDVRELEKHNNLVMAYINLGHAEEWRDYWSHIKGKFWVHESTEYEGEYFVEYWRKEWQDIILSKVEKAESMGFQGVYFDNIDAYVSIRENGYRWARGMDLEELMVQTVVNLSKTIKEKYGNNFKIFVNIGSALELLERENFLRHIDGVLREEVWYTTEDSKSIPMSAEETSLAIKYLENARLYGKTVIVADFIENKKLAQKFCEMSWNHGFIPVPQPTWLSDYSEPPPKDWCSGS